MADQELVKRLRRSSSEWNQWRQAHPDQRPDLSGSDLSSTNLSGSDLYGAYLNGADLHEANLSYAILTRADLHEANLVKAKLSIANLVKADLREADLHDADLREANLTGTAFDGTILARVRLAMTTFSWVNLSGVEELETAIHEGPSAVDINSVKLPHDEHIRKHFLRGVGFTETQIEYLPSLLTPRPIQYHSLFLSYAHLDQPIAERLYTDLRKQDIPCWFASHELVPGDYYRYKIDEAIHRYDKLVLILSRHSIKSHWVEQEVETALKREESMNMDKQILFPIRLDDAVMTTNRRWISSLRFLRHIGDFTGWQDDGAYQQAFERLLRHLKVSEQPIL